MIKNTPKHSIPIENWEIKFKLSKINTNLEELGFSDLPQSNWWKRRSCFEDHVPGVGFEFVSFNILGSRVFSQDPRRENEFAWEGGRKREKWAKILTQQISIEACPNKCPVWTHVCEIVELSFL
jgi:hypothetical protein